MYSFVVIVHYYASLDNYKERRTKRYFIDAYDSDYAIGVGRRTFIADSDECRDTIGNRIILKVEYDRLGVVLHA